MQDYSQNISVNRMDAPENLALIGAKTLDHYYTNYYESIKTAMEQMEKKSRPALP